MSIGGAPYASILMVVVQFWIYEKPVVAKGSCYSLKYGSNSLTP
jgi:hypothetical protein